MYSFDYPSIPTLSLLCDGKGQRPFPKVLTECKHLIAFHSNYKKSKVPRGEYKKVTTRSFCNSYLLRRDCRISHLSLPFTFKPLGPPTIPYKQYEVCRCLLFLSPVEFSSHQLLFPLSHWHFSASTATISSIGIWGTFGRTLPYPFHCRSEQGSRREEKEGEGKKGTGS